MHAPEVKKEPQFFDLTRNRNRMKNNEVLQMRGKLESEDSSYLAELNSQGVFIVYRGAKVLPENIVWQSSKSEGTKPYELRILDNGDMGVFDSKMTMIWHTNTENKGMPPFMLELANTGVLILYDYYYRKI